MKTAFEIAKEQLKDFTEYPTASKIIRMMEMYAEEANKRDTLKHQLFIGKVQDVIGFDETLKLLRETNEAFK